MAFRRSALALALACLLVPASTRAETLYSIDSALDQLVTVDTATGVVTPVGPCLFGFARAKLAMLGGSLYAINSPSDCVDPWYMYVVKLDPSTGAMTNVTNITLGGPQLATTGADGLTSDGTQLLFSYRSTSADCQNSHNLADLATGGALSNVTSFLSGAADMDNLASGPGGVLVATDGVAGSPNNRTDLYVVARPSTYVLVGSHDNSGASSYYGLTFTPTGQLWGLERGIGVSNLRRIDPATAQVLQTLPTSIPIYGLAAAPALPTRATHRSWGELKLLYR